MLVLPKIKNNKKINTVSRRVYTINTFNSYTKSHKQCSVELYNKSDKVLCKYRDEILVRVCPILDCARTDIKNLKTSSDLLFVFDLIFNKAELLTQSEKKRIQSCLFYHYLQYAIDKKKKSKCVKQTMKTNRRIVNKRIRETIILYM